MNTAKLYRGTKGDGKVTMVSATVTNITTSLKGTVAIARTSYGTNVKFYVERPRSEHGARRQVTTHFDRDLPIITNEGARFNVQVGTKVMLDAANTSGYCYPVVSCDRVSRALKDIRAGKCDVEVIGPPKGHRWVD